MENNTLTQKMCQTAFGLFVGPTIDPAKVECSKKWVHIFAQVAHRIGDDGYDVSVFSSDRETRLDMPIPDGHKMHIILDREAEDSPFIYFRFMPFDSLYFEDVVQPIFCDSEILHDFTPYRSTSYSHPICGKDEDMVDFIYQAVTSFCNGYSSRFCRLPYLPFLPF